MSPRAGRMLAALFVALALVAILVSTTHRLRYLERANALGIGGAAASGRGERVHRLLPAPYTDGYMWLNAVGQAVVINPKPKLARLARDRGWRIESWTAEAGST